MLFTDSYKSDRNKSFSKTPQAEESSAFLLVCSFCNDRNLTVFLHDPEKIRIFSAKSQKPYIRRCQIFHGRGDAKECMNSPRLILV